MEPKLIDGKMAAAVAGISLKTLIRLADSGRAPRPVKLGRCNRWRVQDLESWIANGCPSCPDQRRHIFCVES